MQKDEQEIRELVVTWMAATKAGRWRSTVLDAGADLAQLRRLLVDLDVITRLHETGSSRQTADTGGNQDPFRHKD